MGMRECECDAEEDNFCYLCCGNERTQCLPAHQHNILRSVATLASFLPNSSNFVLTQRNLIEKRGPGEERDEIEQLSPRSD